MLHKNIYKLIPTLGASDSRHCTNWKDQNISLPFSHMGYNSAPFYSFFIYFKFCKVLPSVNPASGIRDKKPIMSKNGMCMENMPVTLVPLFLPFLSTASWVENRRGSCGWDCRRGPCLRAGRSGLSPFPPTQRVQFTDRSQSATVYSLFSHING